MGARDGFSTVRAAFDALVSAKTIGDKNVHLEHVTLHRRNRDFDFVQLPGENQLASVFSGPGGNRSCNRSLPLADFAGHAAIAGFAGSGRYANENGVTGTR